MTTTTGLFWSDFDQKHFHQSVAGIIDREISEAFLALKAYVQQEHPGRLKQSEAILQQLERRARQNSVEDLGIFQEYCKQRIFEEPPTSFESLVQSEATDEDETKLDEEVQFLLLREAQLKAETKSLQQRDDAMRTLAGEMSQGVKRVRQAVQEVDDGVLVQLDEGLERLNHLSECSKELGNKLPSLKVGSLENSVYQEKKGMPSTRELSTLLARMEKSKF